ncbi:MAG: DUF4402 domain-containing protein [Coxiellaceae bacterium]|nr:DUF4402 domain-containing protein [Coxiellaceae bacterium]
MKLSKKLIVTSCALAVLAATSAYADRAGDYGQTNFNVALVLFSEIEVEKVTDLNFGDVMLNGAKNITVNVNDDGVAKFRATGDRNARIVAKVVQKSIKIKSGTSGPNHEIVVDNWIYGGNVNGKGMGQFDVNGNIQNIRVGGVAHILANTKYGNYSGSATLRVTYL